MLRLVRVCAQRLSQTNKNYTNIFEKRASKSIFSEASQIGIDYSEMQDLLEGYNPAEVRYLQDHAVDLAMVGLSE